MDTKTYLGNAPLNEQATKSFKFVIKDSSVTTTKVADKSITMDKLATDVDAEFDTKVNYTDLSDIGAGEINTLWEEAYPIEYKPEGITAFDFDYASTTDIDGLND